jgi:hypothetical protein
MTEMNFDDLNINNYFNSYTNPNQDKIINKLNYIFKKGPNCPLRKGPFIKMRIECKNIHKLMNSKYLKEEKEIDKLRFTNFLRATNINKLDSKQNLDKESLLDKYNQYNVNPKIKITLNDQVMYLPAINHSNPKWINKIELNIDNYKEDKIFFEIFDIRMNIIKDKAGDYMTKDMEIIENRKTYSNEEFLGFQVIPIKYLEKNNLANANENKINFEIINKKPDDYFVKEEGHVLNLKNHDPKNYKIEEILLNEYNEGK